MLAPQMKMAPYAAKFLERSLLFTFIMHGLAMLGMAGLLLPGMPGGTHLDVASRAAFVAGHPWVWRIGWLGWQLTAASDLLLAIALVATRWIWKTAALLTLGLTVLGLIPDQYGQAMWTWRGVEVARAAVASANYGEYLRFESAKFLLVAGYGTVGYLSAALGWTWCFARAGTWNRFLTRLSWWTWGLFAISTSFLFLPKSHPLPVWLAKVTSAGNAIAFVLLMIWLLLVTELVLRRSRPTTADGHWAPWRSPRAGSLARLSELIANSRFARFVGEHLPILTMASDITDVVYINYLLPADNLEKFVSLPLRLQRLGPDRYHAMFSILIYRHGHFGPRCFGPLRRLWPNPIQSNWRVYVTDPGSQLQGVQFITTSITSLPHALATRILSEGVPMHIPAKAKIDREHSEDFLIEMISGNGSSADLSCRLKKSATMELPDDWKDCFISWDAMLDYCVPQNRALVWQPWYGRLLQQKISLEISNSDCQSFAGEVNSVAAAQIAGKAKPVCFGAAKVSFLFLGEQKVL
jgi:hypothetical protein